MKSDIPQEVLGGQKLPERCFLPETWDGGCDLVSSYQAIWHMTYTSPCDKAERAWDYMGRIGAWKV